MWPLHPIPDRLFLEDIKANASSERRGLEKKLEPTAMSTFIRTLVVVF